MSGNMSACFTPVITASLLHAYFVQIFTIVSLFLQDLQLNSADNQFSPSKIKQWAMDDLAQTVSWLESQEEKVSN
jgi:hypothetical protein